ncbi:hypothetical protein M9H77_16306 [Catharanthus roseus]|uniref:Uncharacterized protein n=1 Tax=Catharanthus roseus TaxID=4058 RepID=A0ACC0B1F0_CATRO|nr:hypothetical protein M9H77_16306 [Catharanthus roseus]
MKKQFTKTPYRFRRALLESPVDQETVLSPDPIFQPINGSSSSSSETRHNFNSPKSPLDSSMALTILVLLTAIFFMGFFSIYIRRSAQEESAAAADTRRHRRHSPRLSSSSSGLINNNRKGKGLDPTVVQALPLISYCEDAKQLITDCPICLTEFQENEIVKMIPHCKHVFHPPCLDTWLSSHVSCPLCRSTQLLLLEKDDDNDEVCLDVKEVEGSTSRIELREGLTVDRADTSAEGMRRTCSCVEYIQYLAGCSITPNPNAPAVNQASMVVGFLLLLLALFLPRLAPVDQNVDILDLLS